ncbi:MAG: patatin-like phospholipase family protein [Pseudobdellovibrionaceae bacterium]
MNFLFLLKRSNKVILFTSVFFLTSCQSFKTKPSDKEIGKSPTPSVSATSSGPAGPIGNQEVNPDLSKDQLPKAPENRIQKVGVIFGPGGAKTYAFIGALKEMTAQKLPIVAVVGVEFSALIAAAYSHRLQTNEVEWQLLKFQEDDIFSRNYFATESKGANSAAWKSFLDGFFSQVSLEKFSIPFACPSRNLEKGQVFLLNRGRGDQVMNYCVPYPPLFKPYNQSVSAIREIKLSAEFLRRKGAQKILLVQALEKNPRLYSKDQNKAEDIIWKEIAYDYSIKNEAIIDEVLYLDTTQVGIMEFNKKRDIIQIGQSETKNKLPLILQKWGL